MEYAELFTLVILTRNRYSKLLRLLKFYESYDFPVSIKILDSSKSNVIPDEINEFLNNNSIRYEKFDESLIFGAMLNLGLQDITSPYCGLCADDDFIFPTGINSCLEFLENNKDYAVAHGHYFQFNQISDMKQELEWSYSSNNFRSIENRKSEIRFSNHLLAYCSPTFYAVHRTEILLNSWRKAEKYSDDIRFGELIASCCTAIDGKIKYLDDPYSAREYNIRSWGHTAENMRDFFKNNTFDKKFEKFSKCISSSLNMETGPNERDVYSLIGRAMDEYLKSNYGHSRIAFRIRSVLIKITEIIGIKNFIIGLRQVFNKEAIVTHKDSRSPDNAYSNSENLSHSIFLKINDLVKKYP